MTNPALDWTWQALREYVDQDAPVTYSLLGIIIGIYAAEVYFMVRYNLDSTQVFATGLFGVLPVAAWPLAPVLHKGFLHFASSLFGVFLLGVAVEQTMSRWRYVAFLVVSAYLSTAAGVLVMWVFADGRLAFYGSSGIIFALAGYTVATLPWVGRRLREFEKMAVVLGLISMLTVLVDPLTGPYFTVHWVNGGHLGGIVVGLLFARF